MAKKKASTKKRSVSAKPTRSAPASRPRKLAQPKKELAAVQKDISKARRPLYALNRKIKDAPNRYQAGKLKKQRKEFLQANETRLAGLIDQRTELKQKIKQFDQFKAERSRAKRQVKSLEKKLQTAADNQDVAEAERLNYLILKQLGEIDRLDEKMGASLKKTDKTKLDRDEEEEDAGEGYEIDMKSPYAIWEAIKQLHVDLENADFFKFFIIDGKRYSSKSPIQITAHAANFWVTIKKRQEGTPYINRFINSKTKSVKYKYYTD